MLYSNLTVQEPDKRISDASTMDLDIENSENCCKCEHENLIDVSQYSHLFLKISNEQKDFYFTLQNNLEEIYKELDLEIEPVCIRDIRSLTPKAVGLCNINNSCITRRRVSVFKH